MMQMETSGPRLQSANNSLRSRGSRGSWSSNEKGGNYIKVSSKDEDGDDSTDDLPQPLVMQYTPAYAAQDHSGYAKCCSIFSFIAIVFLSIVALMLQSNSIYLKVSEENSQKKNRACKECLERGLYLHILPGFFYIYSG